MKKTVTNAGIAAAFLLIAGCANQNHWTSNLGADSPVAMGGVRVANEMPGAEGPVADNSRLALNHRDVARREALARERLARNAETRRRTQVTDNTFTRSSAPVAAAPRNEVLVKREVVVVKKHRAHQGKVHARAVSRDAANRPEIIKQMNREVALNELHHMNQKEIALAKMADSNAASTEIKAEAARIDRDHRRLEARVEEVAKAHEITLAKFKPATYEEVRMDKLEKLTGRDFDLAYAESMADGHKLTAAHLRVLRERVGDADVLALINQALPKVRHHEKSSANLLGTIRTGNDYSARR